MRIGNVELENNIFLAPMAGVTDKPFRIICRQMGAGLVFSEMVSSKGLYYEDANTDELTDVDPEERPVALQIFGSDADTMVGVIERHINPRDDVDILDINMGCPAPKIVKNGDGSALMKKPQVARGILRAVVGVSTKPVTLKIRMGWDHDSINGIEIARIAEDEGISAITIHGRTRDMFYSGEADWDYIKEMKESISIPVIGNGDIFDPKDALDMLNYTGCDAVAIGRGALGNPWIFDRVNRLSRGMKDLLPSDGDKISMIFRHLDMVCDIRGESLGVREMRKHIAWYLKGMPNSNSVKDTINTTKSKGALMETLSEYLKQLGE
ncbi:MAG: tRNA dihydrouridine synthase DusB [Tissierellia bacterium]|nr:tRNA dihydrouridine synthase DusB [Tissierellia bacterium]